MVKIGETVVVRRVSTLLSGCKTVNGKHYLTHTLRQLIEGDDLILMEVCKVSARKYQLTFVITEDNSYCIEDDEIFFTADWYDIKILNAATECEYYNSLFGETKELRVQREHP